MERKLKAGGLWIYVLLLVWSEATYSPATLMDDSVEDCVGQYRCYQICIPTDQVCDGKSHCPLADDEDLCDFRCPDRCSCHRGIADCSLTNFTVDNILELPNTTRNLDISNNDISEDNMFSIPKPFPLLFTLKAIRCRIKWIREHTFNMTVNLLHLDLSYNNIQVIQRYTFDGLTQLQTLLLEGNFGIESIEQYSFVSLKSLTELLIRNTKINEILSNTFAGLTVKVLDISDSKINKVHGFAMNNLSVAYLRLDGNEILYFDRDIFSGIIDLRQLRGPSFKICCFKPAALPENKCLPSKDNYSSCENLMRNSALRILLWVIGIASLVGNLCVLVYRIVYDRDTLKIGFGMFVTNLAISNFLMGVYMMTIAIVDISFRTRYIEMDDYWRNSGWCTLAGILATVSVESSVLFLFLITIDRLLEAKYPLDEYRLDFKKAILCAGFSWTFAWIVAIVPVLHTSHFQDRFYSSTGVCFALPLSTSRHPPGRLYSFLIFICLNFFIFILIALGQVMIYHEIKQNSRMVKLTSKRRNDLMMTRNIFFVIMTDFMCWFPIGVMGMLAQRGHEIPKIVYAWTTLVILPINSALNPIVYTLAAILGKKLFNTRDDEHRKKTKAALSGSFVKFWNSEAIVPMTTEDYNVLGDLLLLSNITATPREALKMTMTLFHSLGYLHDSGVVHGRINDRCIIVHRDDWGKATFLIHPKKFKGKGNAEKQKDVGELGQVIKQLLRRVKPITKSAPNTTNQHGFECA